MDPAMKPRDITIAVVWIAVLANAFLMALRMGHLIFPAGTVKPFPPTVAWFVVLPFFFLFSSIGAFLVRHRMFDRLDRGWIRALVDRKWGAGTYRDFLERFRPTVLIMVASLIIGVVGLASTYVNDQSPVSYFNSAFSLSCGLGLLVAYCLSWRFPPRLH
jgi:hypothetical protein